MAIDRLTPLKRHRLPLGKQDISHILALSRSHPLKGVFRDSCPLFLFRRQTVPSLEIPANLFLPGRRQIAESLIILHKPLLLLGWHVPQLIDPFRRQSCHCASVRLRFSAILGGLAASLNFAQTLAILR